MTSSWTSDAVLENWGKNRVVRQRETLIRTLTISQLLLNYSPFMELQKLVIMTVTSITQGCCFPGLSHTKHKCRCLVKWLQVCVILSSGWSIKVGQRRVDCPQSGCSVLIQTIRKHQLKPKATLTKIWVFSCLASRGMSNFLPVNVQETWILINSAFTLFNLLKGATTYKTKSH